jgi:hypothetical protein
MALDPKKEKIVNTEPEPVVNPANDKNLAEEIDKEPLAPVDPRLRKSSEDPLQANQDPLNGVNE